MRDHDRFCPEYMQYADPCPICIVIASARADERERERGRRIDRYDTTTIQEILSDEREALRAQVESLSPINDTGQSYLLRDDVLALIDGISNA